MRNRYSISEFIKTAYSLVLTKITFPQARLIRRPVYIRGGRSIVGADNLTTGRCCRFDLRGNKKTLYIGKNCEMGDMTHIVAYKHIKIGDNVLIASKCFISDTNHGSYNGKRQDSPETAPNERMLISDSVIIGNNVWIGENAVILPGTRIGDGCIVGANSVVKGFISRKSVVVGASKIVKEFSDKSDTWVRKS